MSKNYPLKNKERIEILRLAVKAAIADPKRKPEDIFKVFYEAVDKES